jgi:hypothetical protein
MSKQTKITSAKGITTILTGVLLSILFSFLSPVSDRLSTVSASSGAESGARLFFNEPVEIFPLEFNAEQNFSLKIQYPGTLTVTLTGPNEVGYVFNHALSAEMVPTEVREGNLVTVYKHDVTPGNYLLKLTGRNLVDAGSNIVILTEFEYDREFLRQNITRVTPWEKVSGIELKEKGDEVWILVEWNNGRSATPRHLQATLTTFSGEIRYDIFDRSLIQQNDTDILKANGRATTTVFTHLLKPSNYYYIRLSKVANINNSTSYISLNLKVIFIQRENERLMLILTALVFFVMTLFPSLMVYIFQNFGKGSKNNSA